MIKNFTPRLYQETILASAAKTNTLVVLPTGLGKTNIFLMIAANRLKQFPNSKIVLIGPTKPLIDQYFNVFAKHFDFDLTKMCVLTGAVSPKKRYAFWNSCQIIFSTPQGLENDILGGKIKIDNVSLMGFDEAHRAVGDYSYVWIAGKYFRDAAFPRIVGMTASPGSNKEKITEVCNNLYIENIEVRTEEDPDVKPYMQEVEIDYIKVDLPEQFNGVKKSLEACIKSKLDMVKKFGLMKGTADYTKGQLLKLQAGLQVRLARGERDFMFLKAVSLLAEAMKASHALELLESQGISPLHKYLQRLQDESKSTKVKALKNLLIDPNFKDAIIRTQSLYQNKIDHPKLDKLKELIQNELANGKEKIIIFNQFRDSALKIKEVVDQIEKVKSEIFVGQAKKGETGLSQKEQKAMLEKFRAGHFNTLIATSIGEEGLDIIKVDTVIFYEPTPSAIRSIQRRGRTGRQEKGQVIVLIARNTRDEAFRWVAHHKEQKMYRILNNLKSGIKLKKKTKLTDYAQEKSGVKIFADHREKGPIAKELSNKGIDIELKALPVADYLCSSRVAVEVKTTEDFVSSIIDGRLLQQLNSLRTHYEKPVVIIQGTIDIYSVRNVHPNAIRGMIATIAIDYEMPIIHTKDEKETAGILTAIAKREQDKKHDDIQIHNQKPTSLNETQEYVVASLPGVEATIAKSLLKKFKTIKKIVNASEDMLKETELIGNRKASEIRRVLDAEYEN